MRGTLLLLAVVLSSCGPIEDEGAVGQRRDAILGGVTNFSQRRQFTFPTCIEPTAVLLRLTAFPPSPLRTCGTTTTRQNFLQMRSSISKAGDIRWSKRKFA